MMWIFLQNRTFNKNNAYVILVYSPHYVKSLHTVFEILSRSFSVPCAPFSMLGGHGRTGRDPPDDELGLES